MNTNFKQKNKGFTLVETLIAIAIFSVSILGLMSVLASGISNTGYAKQKIIASYLAQEGIEYVRNMRDTKVLFGSGNSKWTQFQSDFNSCTAKDHACGFSQPLPFGGIFQCSAANDQCKLYINSVGGYDTDATGATSGFARKIWMVQVPSNADEVRIFSEVSWTQGSGTYNVTFSENLFNWY